jgi:Fe-S oxidoreductase
MNHAKTFDAIDKLKEIESELHRLKNALELANRALEAEREKFEKLIDELTNKSLHAKLNAVAAEREAIAQKFDGPVWSYDYREIAAAIRARGQE